MTFITLVLLLFCGRNLFQLFSKTNFKKIPGFTGWLTTILARNFAN